MMIFMEVWAFMKFFVGKDGLVRAWVCLAMLLLAYLKTKDPR